MIDLKKVKKGLEVERKKETIKVTPELKKIKKRIAHLIEYGEPIDVAELRDIFRKLEIQHRDKLRQGDIDLLTCQIEQLDYQRSELSKDRKRLSVKLSNLKRKPKNPEIEPFIT